MTVDNKFFCFNPGDLSFLKGEDRNVIERKKVLILGSRAEAINPTEFDDIVPLGGSSSVDENEEQVLTETTR